MAPPTRIIMLGTGDFALPTFDYLCETNHQVVQLITQPDRPQGRKQELIPSRIKTSALARGVHVFQPEDVNAADSIAAIQALSPDLLVTAAYGQILSPALLAVPRLGGINLHGSILPSYRGAAPVARAIEQGETEAGVTVILMSPKIDAGGMISIAKTPIDPDETAGLLEDRLAHLGAPLIADAVSALASGNARILKQDRSKVTKAPKLRKEDGLIDWARPAFAIHNLVRAMQPWPIASTSIRRARDPSAPPQRLLVHKTLLIDEPTSGEHGVVLEASPSRFIVSAGIGQVQLLVVQFVGRKAMPSADLLRGFPVSPGDIMGS